MVLITNAGTKTVISDVTTAREFPSTLNLSNLVIGAPAGAVNTLRLAHGGTETPLRIFRALTVNHSGAVLIDNAALNLEGPPGSSSRIDGAMTLREGAFTATNASQLYIGSSGHGSLTVSGGVFRAYYPIVGINDGASGTWHIAGGTNIATAVMDLGDSLTATGTVWVTGGLLNAPSVYVGLFGRGNLVVSNGTFLCDGQVDVASQPGAQGNFVVTGNGRCSVGSVIVSEGPGATGTVVVAQQGVVQVNGPLENRSGTVRLEGGTLSVGELLLLDPDGQFLFHRGTLQTRRATVTNATFVVGNGIDDANYQLLSTTNETNSFGKGLCIAPGAMLTGSGLIAGQVTNSGVIAPGDSIGRLEIRGGLVVSNSADLRFEIGGHTAGSDYDFLGVSGEVVLAGKLSISLLDDFQGVMTNGASFVVMTNSAAFTGTFANVASGNTLTTTDSYARFTVIYAASGTLRLNDLAILDSDSDGLPDWWEDRHGLVKSTDDAAQDPDGDGAANIDEFRAGTSPNDAASVFRITSLWREGGDVRLTWNIVGGKSYRVQTNAPWAAGGLTTNFGDVSASISTTNAGEGMTNFLHVGGFEANLPGRYYRVRLGP